MTADARRSQAKARFDEGVNAFREHRWTDAVQAFRQADAIAPSAPLSFNIAKAYEHLEDTVGALRWYRDYLRRSPQAANAAEVQARVVTLAAALAVRGVQQLTVLSTPSGAAVSIDNAQVGTAPVTLELAPGQHLVRLELPGYARKQVEFLLDARSPQDVALQLESLTAPPAAVTPAAVTPAAISPSPVLAPPRRERPFGVVPWIVMGAGGVGLLGALGFELGRRSAESDAKGDTQLAYQDHYDTMHGRQTSARVLLGVGGALVVTGGVLLALNRPKQPEAAVALACGPGSCGLSLRRSFE